MIEIRENSNVLPLCPHCKNEIRVINSHAIGSVFGKRYVYFCPTCRAVLGVSHRKGFWMG